jgi:hypothetical protein
VHTQRRYDSLRVDNRPQQTIGESCCPQCGNPCDAGLIFCAKCGAVLRPPVALVESSLDDAHPARPPRLIMRIFLKVIRIVAGIAAVVAIFCPFSTFTLIFMFLGSIAVLLICHAALMAWDDKYFSANSKDGYWPPKPMDWNPTPTGQEAAREHAGEDDS